MELLLFKIGFLNDIKRSSFHIVIYTADVLAYNANGKQLDPTYKHRADDDGSPACNDCTVYKLGIKGVQNNQKSHSRHQKTKVRSQS